MDGFCAEGAGYVCDGNAHVEEFLFLFPFVSFDYAWSISCILLGTTEGKVIGIENNDFGWNGSRLTIPIPCASTAP